MKPNYQNADMLDMVFEGRNQTYGAYVLRRDYNKSLQQAMFVMLTATLLFCFGNYLHDKLSKKNLPDNDHSTFNPHDLPPLVLSKKEELKLAPKKPEPQPKAKAAAKDLEKTIVHNQHPNEDSIPPTKDLQKVDAGTTTNTAAPASGLGTPEGTGSAKSFVVQKPAQPVAANDWTRTPDVMPEYPGGEKALMAYLARNISFPNDLRDIGISGNVISEFTINEDGTVSDVHIVRSPAAGFDREVIRVVRTLPVFKPGLQNGHPVKVRFMVPVFFRLDP